MSDMLLLGAGASKDAGLPDAFELTQRVMDWAVEAGDELTARVLSFIAGGLLFHAARKGSNPFGAKMDSESVYRALDLLANRKEAELAAFVAGWQTGIAELERRWDNSIVLAKERFVIGIAHVLWDVPQGPEYLSPILGVLANQPQVTIASLNYDRVVEQLCERSETSYGVGIPKSGGYNPRKGLAVEFGDERVRLLKLHGSLSWTFHTNPKAAPGLAPERFALSWGSARPSYSNTYGMTPAVLFGGTNKLTADGPFLDLFAEFRASLKAATRLVVVGYSFRDSHVNRAITSYVNEGAETKRLVIVDPYPPESAFVKDLAVALGNRLTIIQEPARSGLARALE